MKLSDWMQAENLSDRDVAEKIGSTPQSVQLYRTGKRVPLPDKMLAISMTTRGEVRANDFYEAPDAA